MRAPSRMREEKLRRELASRTDWHGYAGASFTNAQAAHMVAAIAVQVFQGGLKSSVVEHMMHVAVRAGTDRGLLATAEHMRWTGPGNMRGLDRPIRWVDGRVVDPKLKIRKCHDLWHVDLWDGSSVLHRTHEEAVAYVKESWSW